MELAVTSWPFAGFPKRVEVSYAAGFLSEIVFGSEFILTRAAAPSEGEKQTGYLGSV